MQPHATAWSPPTRQTSRAKPELALTRVDHPVTHPAITPPEVVAGDDSRTRHMMWAMWDEDSNGQDAHIGFWRTSDGRIAVSAMQSNLDVRGRAMLQWLAGYALPVHVVDVILEAIGFWDTMLEEGLICDWDPADGFDSPLERLSIPLDMPRIAA